MNIMSSNIGSISHYFATSKAVLEHGYHLKLSNIRLHVVPGIFTRLFYLNVNKNNPLLYLTDKIF